MTDPVKNGPQRPSSRDGNGRFTAGNGNTGRPKGAKSKFTTLKNEFVRVFEEHGGPARLAELMAQHPEKYFEFLKQGILLLFQCGVDDVASYSESAVAASMLSQLGEPLQL